MSMKKTLVTLSTLAALAAGAFAVPLFASADSVAINFESPTYSLGNINGQDGWSMTGPYDVAVSSSGGVAGFGSQSFRISDAVTSGSFGDWAFAKPLVNAVGEASSTNGTFSAGTLQRHFEMQFDIAATTTQPGLFMSVSPDRGDGSRMSYLGFGDTPTGIHVVFYDVQGTSNPANFEETDLGTYAHGVPHTVKLTLDTLDGPSNDVVKVWIDGTLVHTGTSWENYYRYDSEAAVEQSPRIVKTVIFQARGTAHPAHSGKGFLIDNLSLSSGPIPAETQTCSTITLVSATSTQTAGYTEAAQAGPATALLPWSYSDGFFRPAFVTQTVIPPWVNPATNPSFSGSGAVWVSSSSTWPGGAGNSEGNPNNNQWRLFEDGFSLPWNATVTSATLSYTADNAADVYFNGNTTPIATTNDVYGSVPGSLPFNFSNVYSTSFSPTPGYNSLQFVVRNWGGNFNPNPTGVLYKATVNYCVPVLTGSLVVTKQVTNYPVPTTFTFTGTGGIGTFTITASKNNDGSYTVSNLVPGTYTITETVPGGWIQNTTSCSSVVVTAGQTAACTIKNTKTQSTNVHVSNSNFSIVHTTTSAGSNTGGNAAGSFGGTGGSAWYGSNASGGIGGTAGSITTGNAFSSSHTMNGVNFNFTSIFH